MTIRKTGTAATGQVTGVEDGADPAGDVTAIAPVTAASEPNPAGTWTEQDEAGLQDESGEES